MIVVCISAVGAVAKTKLPVKANFIGKVNYYCKVMENKKKKPTTKLQKKEDAKSSSKSLSKLYNDSILLTDLKSVPFNTSFIVSAVHATKL